MDGKVIRFPGGKDRADMIRLARELLEKVESGEITKFIIAAELKEENAAMTAYGGCETLAERAALAKHFDVDFIMRVVEINLEGE